MRPRSEIRHVLFHAANDVVAQGAPGATWKALVQVSGLPIGLDVARRTVDNMVRAGELVVVGYEQAPGVSRPMSLYAPAANEPAGDAVDARDASAALSRLLLSWSSGAA